MRGMLRVIVIALPMLLASAWVIRELKLYRREVEWQKRRQLVDALRITLHYKAEERDREAAEKEAFDRKLKEGEEDDGGDKPGTPG